MSEKVNATNSAVGWLERTLLLVEKYSFWNILKALMLIIITACVAFFTLNPSWLFERIQKYIEDEHTRALEKRELIDPLVREELLVLASQTNADRAWVIEFHNGTTSLAGLPFRYGDMTYEQPPREISMMDTNQNISLSRFQFITHLYEDGYWYGDLSELEEIDKSFYYKMKSEGVQYLAIMTLQGIKNPIGFLAVSYKDTLNIDEKVLGRNIRNSSVKLCNWLDHDK